MLSCVSSYTAKESEKPVAWFKIMMIIKRSFFLIIVVVENVSIEAQLFLTAALFFQIIVLCRCLLYVLTFQLFLSRSSFSGQLCISVDLDAAASRCILSLFPNNEPTTIASLVIS